MTRRLSLAAVCLSAFACTGFGAEPQLTPERDYATPVRPIGVNGQEAWNAHAKWFLYAPTFGFTNRADAVSYRFTVTDAKGGKHVFRAKSAHDSLAPVWNALPVGWTRVVCEATDGADRALGVVGSREFGRQAPFREDMAQEPKRSAAATAALILRYVMDLPIVKAAYLSDKPVPAEMVDRGNQVFVSYPAKMGSAIMRAMAKLAESDPASREAALRLAEGVRRKLFSITEPEGTALAGFPRTYEAHPGLTGHPAKMAAENGGKIMLIYPCKVADAYLTLYAVTKDASLRDAALKIADLYLRLQGTDGTWPLNCWRADGRAVEANRLVPVQMMNFLERVYALTGDLKYRAAADAAFAYVEKGPLRTWNWEGQFEDAAPSAKFVNLTKHNACDTAIYLTRRFPDDPQRIAQARELLRFAEDQFVCWEAPVYAAKKLDRSRIDTWRCPAVLEQYGCYLPIDASSAKLIRTYLALHGVAHEPLDLAKARTLGASAIRETRDDGHLPTFWCCFQEDWPNCMLASAFALLELGKTTPGWGCPDADWAARRAAAVNRDRTLVYNTDGCDMLYYPSNLPVTVEAFTGYRLAHAKGTRVNTLSYCPQSAGFGHFTCLKAGEAFLRNGSEQANGAANALPRFAALGTDALEMACGYARRNGWEAFVSVRVNDTHDAAGSLENPSPLFPEFKRRHPECLMGRGRGKGERPPFCNWSAVDFERAEVRAHMRKFVRELVENYDVDGIEYDFNRHMQLFKTVAWGAEATAAQLDLMTGFMRELKAITEEVGRRKNRPIVIAMRAPDSVGYCRAVGIDLERWFSEKLVDLWIGAGYFRLNPWTASVELAHRYGIRFYASLDESRIPRVTDRKRLPIIPGRMTEAFYAARIADAMASGCDGVYLFNIEYDALHRMASIDPRNTASHGKIRFAVDRGSGGMRPDLYLKDGKRFDNLPKIDPGEPRAVAAGETVSFRMFFGDPAAPVRALVQTNLPEGRTLRLSCNGRAFEAATGASGLAAFPLPAGTVRTGMNDFSVTFSMSDVAGCTFNDFALENERQ